MISVWFYKGKGRWIDWLIRWWTKSKYSHCEIAIKGMAYSADAWTNSVRTTTLAAFNPENWDVIQCPVDDIELVHKRLLSQLGKKYDFLGIFGQALGIKIQSSKRWYCSEYCSMALGFNDNRVIPDELYANIILRGGEPCI